MGICTSSGGIEISEDDKQRHREAEKVLKEVSFHSVLAAVHLCIPMRLQVLWRTLTSNGVQAKTKLAVQVKVRFFISDISRGYRHMLPGAATLIWRLREVNNFEGESTF